MAGAACLPVHMGGAVKDGKTQGKSGSRSTPAQDTEEWLGPSPKVLLPQALLAKLISRHWVVCG